MTLPFRIVDADNHYYEAEDAFTRHLPAEYRDRAVRWIQMGRHRRLLVGDRLHTYIANPTFDPIVRPGALHDYFRGVNPEGKNMKETWGELEPIRPEYRDVSRRMEVMDEQGLEAAFLFPTLGVGVEAGLTEDPEACSAAFTAFNRWLEDDWGYATENRIFAAPYLSLADPALAVAEVDRLLEAGARILVMRPAPAFTAEGPRSPADPMFDDVWARIDEARIPVAVHTGDSGYGTNGYARAESFATFGGAPPIRTITANLERPIMDFLGALAVDRLFERFPNVRILSVENGSQFLPQLLALLDKINAQRPGAYDIPPAQALTDHLWVAPFWEDRAPDVVEVMGPDRVVLGSDWPHAEGLSNPADYVDELSGVATEHHRKIMRENALNLIETASA